MHKIKSIFYQTMYTNFLKMHILYGIFKVLYMAHNYVREWREFEHLSELPILEDLVFVGNPLEEDSSTNTVYIDQVIRRLLFLKKLDGFPVIREQENNTEEEVCQYMDIEEIDRLARY